MAPATAFAGQEKFSTSHRAARFAIAGLCARSAETRNKNVYAVGRRSNVQPNLPFHLEARCRAAGSRGLAAQLIQFCQWIAKKQAGGYRSTGIPADLMKAWLAKSKKQSAPWKTHAGWLRLLERIDIVATARDERGRIVSWGLAGLVDANGGEDVWGYKKERRKAGRTQAQRRRRGTPPGAKRGRRRRELAQVSAEPFLAPPAGACSQPVRGNIDDPKKLKPLSKGKEETNRDPPSIPPEVAAPAAVASPEPVAAEPVGDREAAREHLKRINAELGTRPIPKDTARPSPASFSSLRIAEATPEPTPQTPSAAVEAAPGGGPDIVTDIPHIGPPGPPEGEIGQVAGMTPEAVVRLIQQRIRMDGRSNRARAEAKLGSAVFRACCRHPGGWDGLCLARQDDVGRHVGAIIGGLVATGRLALGAASPPQDVADSARAAAEKPAGRNLRVVASQGAPEATAPHPAHPVFATVEQLAAEIHALVEADASLEEARPRLGHAWRAVVLVRPWHEWLDVGNEGLRAAWSRQAFELVGDLAPRSPRRRLASGRRRGGLPARAATAPSRFVCREDRQVAMAKLAAEATEALGARVYPLKRIAELGPSPEQFTMAVKAAGRGWRRARASGKWRGGAVGFYLETCLLEILQLAGRLDIRR